MSYREEPLSPCIQVCKLDPSTNVCIGCYRSIEEIANWRRYSNREKKAALDAACLRRVEATAASSLSQMSPRKCSRCGSEMHCGARDGDGPCWCENLPKLCPVPGPEAECLCPNCLNALLSARPRTEFL
ncbi:MAG TPA: DUF1289 domain-containing protein [Burkholderiales bacterium]|nr:DUF1289 domain-containing protein [Burkholderiales bacterium]